MEARRAGPSYLLSKGWNLRKVHDLEVLVNEAAAYRQEFGKYAKACRKISGYYITERYPLVASPSLTLEEVSHSRSEVEGLVQLVREALS